MKAYQTKTKKLTGTKYPEIYKKSFSIYSKIKKLPAKLGLMNPGRKLFPQTLYSKKRGKINPFSIHQLRNPRKIMDYDSFFMLAFQTSQNNRQIIASTSHCMRIGDFIKDRPTIIR